MCIRDRARRDQDGDPTGSLDLGHVVVGQQRVRHARPHPAHDFLDVAGDADALMAGAVLSRLDGLMLAGGVDVEPHRYGAQPHPSVQEARPDRDAFELALAQATRELDTPVLGVCRGMQVMAVAAGGTLEQHLPDLVGHQEHSPAPGVYGSHLVRTVAGTTMSALLGRQVVIPSYHHQSVSSHPGYVPAAWAPDGTLEAMERPGSRFRLAVQWHPEAGQDDRLFEALVQACGRARG